jgi:hypothetical protein
MLGLHRFSLRKNNSLAQLPCFASRMHWEPEPVRRKSGIGLPHSTTSRKEWRAVLRDSVVECGSPMPLSRVFCVIRKPDPRFMARRPF